MFVPIICIAALLLGIAAIFVVGDLDQWDRALRRRRENYIQSTIIGGD